MNEHNGSQANIKAIPAGNTGPINETLPLGYYIWPIFKQSEGRLDASYRQII